MNRRNTLGAIVDRLEAIEKILRDYTHSVSAAGKDQQNDREKPTEIRGEIWFPEEVEKNRSAQQGSQNTTQRWIARGTWAATAAAVVYAGIAALQGCAMRNANQIAQTSLETIRAQFQIDQRPVIAITKFACTDYTTGKEKPPVIGKPFVINLSTKNVGKSTAFNVGIHRHVIWGRNIGQLSGEPPDTSRHGLAMIQGDEGKISAVSLKDTFAIEGAVIPSSQVATWDGSDDILVFGRITYDDSYGKPYCTPFVAQRLPNGNFIDLDTIGGKPVPEVLCPGEQ